MKKILLSLVISVLLIAPFGAHAADEAVFSATSTKTQYSVGDEITVSFSVDAGPYATTLNVIDMDIKVSDTSVIAPTDESAPFTPGSIYSNLAMQRYTDGVMNVVVYVNPDSQPSSRSGLIGTATFKAQQAGRVTISYDRIDAAEENNETEFVNTSASSLTLEVTGGSSTSGGTTVSDTSGTSSSTTSSTTTYATTSTPAATSVTTTTATTGPEHIVLVIGLGAIAILGVSWYRKTKYFPKV